MYRTEEILEQADRLSAKIQDLDLVKDYRRVEEQIHANHSIDTRMKELKRNQKQAVNFQNYGKIEALKASEHTIQSLEHDINQLPIVGEFRTAQREANDLLQLMIETMSKCLNNHHPED